MPNPARNEVEIPFRGKTYVCRPTFSAVSSIEAAVGKSILLVGQEIATMTASLTTIAIVMMHALKTAPDIKKTLSLADVGDFLTTNGVSGVTGPVGLFCLRAFAGPDRGEEESDEEGEEKAVPLES